MPSITTAQWLRTITWRVEADHKREDAFNVVADGPALGSNQALLIVGLTLDQLEDLADAILRVVQANADLVAAAEAAKLASDQLTIPADEPPADPSEVGFPQGQF